MNLRFYLAENPREQLDSPPYLLCLGDVAAAINLELLSDNQLFEKDPHQYSYMDCYANTEGMIEWYRVSFAVAMIDKELPDMIIMNVLQASLNWYIEYISWEDNEGAYKSEPLLKDAHKSLPGLKILQSNFNGKYAMLHSGVITNFDSYEALRARLFQFYNLAIDQEVFVNELGPILN